MLYFKSCRKCLTGTVQHMDGLDGPEFKCLNCSYTTSVLDESRMPAQDTASVSAA